ncbi:unnamed protein product, partial [Acanthoscelides obtectus]
NPYGVPQGSVLGPLLYSLYVLSLHCANLNCDYFTFADDNVLLYSGDSKVSLETVINNDLDVYYKWLLYNKYKQQRWPQ